ncbi:hypothetical protein LMG29542_06706 [Paraburkholderia humisilvae]|uniref:Chromate transport protein n=1 Tax=Paraburkholderia humisilvae TaxID=627669 RepID=A0A6J5F3E3_9BURK|nr:hypothetical protein LMG29542_06706 [Paraburkholderia humisilvae]
MDAPGDFFAGYGAAQAVPGPLFSLAAYLGWMMQSAPKGLAGAALALVAIFLPGLLLLIGGATSLAIAAAAPFDGRRTAWVSTRLSSDC